MDKSFDLITKFNINGHIIFKENIEEISIPNAYINNGKLLKYKLMEKAIEFKYKDFTIIRFGYRKTDKSEIYYEITFSSPCQSKVIEGTTWLSWTREVKTIFDAVETIDKIS